jgi:hypothetical protein
MIPGSCDIAGADIFNQMPYVMDDNVRPEWIHGLYCKTGPRNFMGSGVTYILDYHQTNDMNFGEPPEVPACLPQINNIPAGFVVDTIRLTCLVESGVGEVNVNRDVGSGAWGKPNPGWHPTDTMYQGTFEEYFAYTYPSGFHQTTYFGYAHAGSDASSQFPGNRLAGNWTGVPGYVGNGLSGMFGDISSNAVSLEHDAGNPQVWPHTGVETGIQVLNASLRNVFGMPIEYGPAQVAQSVIDYRADWSISATRCIANPGMLFFVDFDKDANRIGGIQDARAVSYTWWLDPSYSELEKCELVGGAYWHAAKAIHQGHFFGHGGAGAVDSNFWVAGLAVDGIHKFTDIPRTVFETGFGTGLTQHWGAEHPNPGRDWDDPNNAPTGLGLGYEEMPVGYSGVNCGHLVEGFYNRIGFGPKSHWAPAQGGTVACGTRFAANTVTGDPNGNAVDFCFDPWIRQQAMTDIDVHMVEHCSMDHAPYRGESATSNTSPQFGAPRMSLWGSLTHSGQEFAQVGYYHTGAGGDNTPEFRIDYVVVNQSGNFPGSMGLWCSGSPSCDGARRQIETGLTSWLWDSVPDGSATGAAGTSYASGYYFTPGQVGEIIFEGTVTVYDPAWSCESLGGNSPTQVMYEEDNWHSWLNRAFTGSNPYTISNQGRPAGCPSFPETPFAPQECSFAAMQQFMVGNIVITGLPLDPPTTYYNFEITNP